MTCEDIGKVAFDAVRDLCPDVRLSRTMGHGRVDGERIVVVPPRDIEDGRYWRRSFASVNWCVPDICGEPSPRLEEVGDILSERLGGVGKKYTVGSCKGVTYRYSVSSVGTSRDEGLDLHYVNIRLLFELLNVK